MSAFGFAAGGAPGLVTSVCTPGRTGAPLYCVVAETQGRIETIRVCCRSAGFDAPSNCRTVLDRGKMKKIGIFSAILVVGAFPATAQEKVFGEIGLSYGQSDIDGTENTLDSFSLHGAGAFVSPGGLGVQLGGSYTNLSIDDGGDLETYTLDGHVYGDFGTYEVGAFAGTMRIGELEAYGLGEIEFDTNITSYGVEGQTRIGAVTYHGYAGLADIEDLDDVETTIYGLGADFDVTEALQLTGDYDGMNLSADGFDSDLRVSVISLGVDYYVTAQNAPLRLSAAVGRTSAEVDGTDEDGLTFGIGAAFLFGGEVGSGREKLFDAFQPPF